MLYCADIDTKILPLYYRRPILNDTSTENINNLAINIDQFQSKGRTTMSQIPSFLRDMPAIGIKLPDGTRAYPDGTIIYPGGTIARRNGTVQHADGRIDFPSASLLQMHNFMLERLAVTNHQIRTGQPFGPPMYPNYVPDSDVYRLVSFPPLAPSFPPPPPRPLGQIIARPPPPVISTPPGLDVASSMAGETARCKSNSNRLEGVLYVSYQSPVTGEPSGADSLNEHPAAGETSFQETEQTAGPSEPVTEANNQTKKTLVLKTTPEKRTVPGPKDRTPAAPWKATGTTKEATPSNRDPNSEILYAFVRISNGNVNEPKLRTHLETFGPLGSSITFGITSSKKVDRNRSPGICPMSTTNLTISKQPMSSSRRPMASKLLRMLANIHSGICKSGW